MVMKKKKKMERKKHKRKFGTQIDKSRAYESSTHSSIPCVAVWHGVVAFLCSK